MNPNPRQQSGDYIDAAAFTDLFADPDVNRAAICLGLNRMADGIARRFRFSTDDHDDAVSTATLYAIAQIGKFKPERGAMAFSYFTTVIHNALRKFLRRLERSHSAIRLMITCRGKTDHQEILK